MVFQPVLDTAEITAVFQQNAEPLVNVFHAEKSGGYAQVDITALANNVDSLIATFLLPEMTVDCEYLRTEVRGLAVENDLFAVDGTNGGDLAAGLPNSVTFSIKKVSGLTGRSARGRWYFVGMPADILSANENLLGPLRAADLVTAVDGTNGGFGGDLAAGLPNSVTFSIKKVSGLTGRSARGRWYFVGMPADILSANENLLGPLRAADLVTAVDGVRAGIGITVWNPVIVSRFTAGALRPFGKTFPWVGSVNINDVVDTQRGRLP